MSYTQLAPHDFMSNRIYTNFNLGIKMSGLFLEAFDTVKHELLSESAGIRGMVSSWFWAYPTNRQQFERPGRSVTFGVPQGSVIAQILFLIFLTSYCHDRSRPL